MPVTACEFKSHPAYIQIVHIVSFKSWLYGFFFIQAADWASLFRDR